MLKRVLFTGMGVGVGTAVCYPEQAGETGSFLKQEGCRLYDHAYNSLTGDSTEPFFVLPTLPVPSVDMSLIASGIRRSVTFLAVQGKDMYKMITDRASTLIVSKEVEAPVGSGDLSPSWLFKERICTR